MITLSRSLVSSGLAGAVLALTARPADAQSGDTLRLRDLQQAAVTLDPRGTQRDLIARQTALRLETIRRERYPLLTAASSAQYQSDVTSVPLPGAIMPFKDTYDANAAIRLRLLDPSRTSRASVERAQEAEAVSRVGAATFVQRQAVNDAFFTVRVLDAQRAVTAAGIADLEVHLRLARERVQAGASLPSEAAMVEAELLRRRQTLEEIATSRGAALALLGDLTGRLIPAEAVLASPSIPDVLTKLTEGGAQRPEYQSFEASRALLAARASALDAQERPRLSAFGRTGYGRPGLNMLSRDFDTYWLAGIQLEWNPFDWGAAQRDRQVLALQRDAVETEERSFSDRLRRAAITDQAHITRLTRAIEADDAIIALRERVVRELQVRHREGVVTVAELVDRDTELQTARLARETRRVELDQARVRLLTTFGLEIP